jgi:hypothetical protein
MPTLLGAVAFFIPGAANQYLVSPASPASVVLLTGLASASFGAVLGTLNGALIGPPKPGTRRRLFSLRGLLVGIVIGVIYVVLTGAFVVKYLDSRPHAVTVLLVLLPPIALACGIAGSIWQFVNVGQAGERFKPRFFSWKGFLAGFALGIITFLVLGLGVLIISMLEPSQISIDKGTSPIAWLTSLMYGLATGVIGGLTRFFFWKINDLPPRGMEVLGIWFILFAFLTQALDPILTLLGVAVR